MRKHGSFAAFQEHILGLPPGGPKDTPLAPGKHVPATTDEVTLSEVPGLRNVVIEFRGDSTARCVG